MRKARFLSILLAVCCFSTVTNADFYDSQGNLKELIIGYDKLTHPLDGVGFYATNDAAGYSDWIWYGPTDIHEHSYHEVLSGEWAAAIYYDGINTSLTTDPNDALDRRQAMYLTQRFSYPDFYTNSDFVYGGTSTAWHNYSNPAPNNNTAKSVIRNGQVEITVDYEVVDLNSVGTSYSPMTYVTDPNSGFSEVVFSDRYIILQTYSVRNLTSSTLTGLEFYQMLHSHGANEYGPQVNSTYSDAYALDPLVSYTPRNPVHQVGNFRYDITQWNSQPYISGADHVDYVSFSSTIEPDWIDNDVFRGGHSDDLINEYTTGGYMNVKERALNGLTSLYRDEVAGSVGWSLGSLDPNQTTSLTVAFMFAPQRESESLVLTKSIVNPELCYNPGNSVVYKIEWENRGATDAHNCVLTDYFPAGVTYEPGQWSVLFDDPNFMLIPPDPQFTAHTNSYEWDLGTIAAGGSGELTIEVVVNASAPPGMAIRNNVVLETSIGTATGSHDLPICCWDSGPVFVDSSATGANTGTSWHDAFTTLQSGLARAAEGCGTEVHVAQGVYDPGRLETDSFVIPDNIQVIGGYKGGTSDGDAFNPKQYITVLAGDTDALRNATIVRMGDNTVLKGFTIRGAGNTEGPSYCVYGSGVDFTLEQCVITDSDWYGVFALNGNVTLRWCEVKHCIDDAIRHQGSGFVLNIENSWLRKNLRRGVATQFSTPHVRNSILTESDLAEGGNAGIRIVNPTSRPTLHGCTFAHNRGEGIFFADNATASDPNDKDWPDVQNCILWYNNAQNEGSQVIGFTKQHIRYSAVYDPNDPQGENLTPDDNSNFSANPKFIWVDPNSLYLRQSSPCKDAGNRLMDYTGQVDFAGRSRVLGDYVDIGAFEIVPSDEPDFHDLDWNQDGRIDLYEFNLLSKAWGSVDPNCPQWDDDPNLYDPNLAEGWYEWKYKCNIDTNGESACTVDLADFLAFVDAPWLWRAYWLDDFQMQETMISGGEMLLIGGDFGELECLQLFSEPLSEPQVSVEEQISELEQSLIFLARIWLEEPDIRQEIGEEAWQEFMLSVYQNMLDLQTDTVQLE